RHGEHRGRPPGAGRHEPSRHRADRSDPVVALVSPALVRIPRTSAGATVRDRAPVKSRSGATLPSGSSLFGAPAKRTAEVGSPRVAEGGAQVGAPEGREVLGVVGYFRSQQIDDPGHADEPLRGSSTAR